MTILLTVVHVLVCVFLVIVVLLQSGKAADLAGAFGGMGSQTAFGPRGSATVLSKATTIAAALFMVTSLSLAILATRNASASSSVLDRSKKQGSTQKSGPAGTAPSTTQPSAAPTPAAPTPAPTAGPPMIELTDPKTGQVQKRVPLDLSKLPQVKNPPPEAPAPKK